MLFLIKTPANWFWIKPTSFLTHTVLAAMELYINGVMCFKCLLSYSLFICFTTLLFVTWKSVLFSQLLLSEESILHCIKYHEWLGRGIISSIYYNSSHSQVVTEITTYGCLFFHRESIDLLFVHSTASWLTIYLGRRYTGLSASTIPLHSSDKM